MNPQAGLSFEQAPPFSLPLRFFLTAPLFLLAAAALIAYSPEALISRGTPQALALTHALTLGFLAMTMLGALMQMLPVVAGSVLPRPWPVARVSHIALALGTPALMAGFLGLGEWALELGAALLALGFLVFLAAAGISLARAAGNVTVTGIRLAVACLALTAALGVALALARSGMRLPLALSPILASHLAFGLLGWVLLLVIGVAYQVVPMFQITPPYPPRLGRWLAGTLFALLLFHAAAPLLAAILGFAIDAAIAGGILVFALATLRLQMQRRRKLPDVTLDFWRLGMASLIAAVPVWAAGQFWNDGADDSAYPVLLGVLFIGGFAVSAVCGMLYKIVPFLAWFHLQAQLQAPAGSIPNMKQMIAEARMRWHFRLHFLALILLVGTVLRPRWLHVPAGIALALSALLLWGNLVAAARRYLAHGGRLR